VRDRCQTVEAQKIVTCNEQIEFCETQRMLWFMLTIVRDELDRLE
jgi:hypothetical protein